MQIERERRELEQLKALLEEKKKLQAEFRRLELEKKALEENKRKELQIQAAENEKQKLAYIPKESKVAKISLRKEPKNLTQSNIKNMLWSRYFFDSNQNPLGEFENDFIVNKDGTITDRGTGLTWQKNGSKNVLSRNSANAYVKKLNQKKFAGFSDWRLPTIEELASLLMRTKKNGLHIHSVFDRRQKRCWSADFIPTTPIATYKEGWIINFVYGHVTYAKWINRAGASWLIKYVKDESNYVRAVRSSIGEIK